jgi:hypothetical protein
LPVIPAPKLCVPCGSSRRLRLLDFRDEQHPLLRRWSQQRRSAYAAARWHVAGAAAVSLLDRFLAARPEVV